MIKEIRLNKPLAGFYNHTFLSLKNKYAYFAVGKAANSTIKHLLFNLEYKNTYFKIKALHDRRCAPLLSPFQMSHEQVEDFLTSSDVFKFTFVRNPYSRLLSCYLDRIVPRESAPYRLMINMIGGKVGDEVSFDTFIRAICEQTPFEMNPHWRNQVNETLYHQVKFDFVGHVESFAEGMATVWEEITGDNKPEGLGDTNKSPSVTKSASRLHKYYSEELAALVEDKYAEDFEIFNYSTNFDD